MMVTISTLMSPTAFQAVEPTMESVGALRTFLARWWWAGAAALVLVLVFASGLWR